MGGDLIPEGYEHLGKLKYSIRHLTESHQRGMRLIPDLLIPLVTVGLAELGDKTQLSLVLLSSKTEKRLQLLLGVMLAFLIVDGIGILLGSWITNVVPESWLKTLSGITFLAFGLMTLLGNRTDMETMWIIGTPLPQGSPSFS